MPYEKKKMTTGYGPLPYHGDGIAGRGGWGWSVEQNLGRGPGGHKVCFLLTSWLPGAFDQELATPTRSLHVCEVKLASK